MSSAIPAALLSAMSTITTSASSRCATDRATVAPTLPAPPTTVTFRFIPYVLLRCRESRERLGGSEAQRTRAPLGHFAMRRDDCSTHPVENLVENVWSTPCNVSGSGRKQRIAPAVVRRRPHSVPHRPRHKYGII